MRRVVITGIGVVTPIGNNVADFWDNLINGRSGIDFIKSFDTTDYDVKIAAEVKNFDPCLLDIDKSIIRRSDLYTHYAIAAAKEAVDDSKLASNINPDRLGVYIGSGIGGIHTLLSEDKKLINEGPRWISPHFIPMMIPNIAASTVAIMFNAMGPCVPLVAACATGGQAIGEAYRNILHGYSDAIIAGGSEATISGLSIAGFTNCKALNKSSEPECASLPFDKRRNGFVLGDGAGVLILEEYNHAKARNAKMYAEICGYGISCDANHVTAPRADGANAAKAIIQAATQAQISKFDNLYINAHGTGTILNDSSETKAIKLALGDKMAYEAHISSNKSMIGHLLGAAGAVEMVATALSLTHDIIPPTINYKEFDPECDLNYTPNHAEKSEITLALSNSFGFGGHNACIAARKI